MQIDHNVECDGDLIQVFNVMITKYLQINNECKQFLHSYERVE